jgi:hypothetical protein
MTTRWDANAFADWFFPGAVYGIWGLFLEPFVDVSERPLVRKAPGLVLSKWDDR